MRASAHAMRCYAAARDKRGAASAARQRRVQRRALYFARGEERCRHALLPCRLMRARSIFCCHAQARCLLRRRHARYFFSRACHAMISCRLLTGTGPATPNMGGMGMARLSHPPPGHRYLPPSNCHKRLMEAQATRMEWTHQECLSVTCMCHAKHSGSCQPMLPRRFNMVYCRWNR